MSEFEDRAKGLRGKRNVPTEEEIERNRARSRAEKAKNNEQVAEVLHSLAERLSTHLESMGYLVRMLRSEGPASIEVYRDADVTYAHSIRRIIEIDGRIKFRRAVLISGEDVDNIELRTRHKEIVPLLIGGEVPENWDQYRPIKIDPAKHAEIAAAIYDGVEYNSYNNIYNDTEPTALNYSRNEAALLAEQRRAEEAREIKRAKDAKKNKRLPIWLDDLIVYSIGIGLLYGLYKLFF